MDSGKYHDTISDLEQIPWTPADSAALPLHTSPDDRCAQCGKPLTDDEPYLCDTCTEHAYCASSPLACEPWSVRTDPYHQPADRFGISVLGVLLLACLMASIVGTAGMEHAQAQDTTLRAPHAINGRIYEWPAIGTPAYSASCAVYQAWEDGSARAYCTEDGASYTFDPEAQAWTPMISTR